MSLSSTTVNLSPQKYWEAHSNSRTRLKKSKCFSSPSTQKVNTIKRALKLISTPITKMTCPSKAQTPPQWETLRINTIAGSSRTPPRSSLRRQQSWFCHLNAVSKSSLLSRPLCKKLSRCSHSWRLLTSQTETLTSPLKKLWLRSALDLIWRSQPITSKSRNKWKSCSSVN